MSLREKVIAEIVEIVGGEFPNAYRWLPIKEYIWKELLGKECTTKKGRKACWEYDLSNIQLLFFTLNPTDDQLLDLYKIAFRQYYKQM